MKSVQVSIDGPARGGKTTLAALLTVLLERCGCEVEVLDPSSGDKFEQVRAELAHNPESLVHPFKVSLVVKDPPAASKTRSRKVTISDEDIYSNVRSPFSNP